MLLFRGEKTKMFYSGLVLVGISIHVIILEVWGAIAGEGFLYPWGSHFWIPVIISVVVLQMGLWMMVTGARKPLA